MANRRSSPLLTTPTAQAPVNAKNFLIAFPEYVRIDVSAPSTRPDWPYELLEFIRLSCITLAKETARFLSLERVNPVLWPSCFAFSDLEARQSAAVKQNRGCFLIGLDLSHVDESKADILRHNVALQIFKESLSSHRVFVDEPATPKLSIKFITQADLGPLVPDQYIWPQSSPHALIVGSKEMAVSDAYFVPAPNDNASAQKETSKKLRPASDVLHRLRWDPSLEAEDYSVVYLDRFTGYQEIPASKWKSDVSDDEFIPLHRITGFRKISTGEVVWSREARVDKIFGT